MFGQIDSLNMEVINVQIFDGYLKNGEIRFDNFFMRDDYKYEMKKYKNLIKNYSDNLIKSIADSADEDGYIDDDYTLDDVLEMLVEELNVYGIIYDVKEVAIDNEEWELFFEAIGKYYIEHDLDGFFMSDMIKLNRYAIARSLVYEEECIDLETYIKSLKYLESNILSINNVIEIAEKIKEVLSVDTTGILVNDDGSYGIKNKGASLLLIDDDVKFDENETMKEFMRKNGYSVVTTLEVVENRPNYNDNNVISFDAIKSKKRAKKKLK